VLLRDGSNVMYRLPGGVVARIGRVGAVDAATREVQVSRWLLAAGIAVVRTIDDLPQPVVVDGRPVTWWEFIPSGGIGSPADLATLLRRLHRLPVPDGITLPRHDPFIDLTHRVTASPVLNESDRAWLGRHLRTLKDRYECVTFDLARCVVHGDAWQGNVVVPHGGAPLLLDLEAVALGQPEWDLVQTAVDHTDFARLDRANYTSFVAAYGGYDVTDLPDYRVLGDIQELRWVCFALSRSATSPAAAREAHHRIACLRGDLPRPWSWTAL